MCVIVPVPNITRNKINVCFSDMSEGWYDRMCRLQYIINRTASYHNVQHVVHSCLLTAHKQFSFKCSMLKYVPGECCFKIKL